MGSLIELAETLEAEAKAARKIECSAEYHVYWRGYAEANEAAAELIRARATMEASNG